MKVSVSRPTWWSTGLASIWLVAACASGRGAPSTTSATAGGDSRGLALIGSDARRPSSSASETSGSSAPPSGPVEEIDAGRSFVCARVASGHVSCWGRNSFGELGNGTFDTPDGPTWVEGISDAVQLDLGMSHACVRHRDGGVSCWGRNWWGESAPDLDRPALTRPVRVVGISSATDVDAGHATTCVVHSGGRVACWGEGHGGQLGAPGSATSHGGPFDVPLTSPVVRVAVGHDVACAFGAGSSMQCWGFGARDFDLGRPDGWVDGPSVIDVGFRLAEASFWPGGGCLRSEDGRMACTSGSGLSGSGYTRARSYPDPLFDILPGLPVLGLEVGNGIVCVLDPARRARCWGNLEAIASSDGSSAETVQRHDVPVPIELGGNVVEVAAGESFVCALLEDRSVRCAGANAFGQLGDGSHTNRARPVTVEVVR